MIYEHTQSAPLLPVVLAAAATLCAVLAAVLAEPAPLAVAGVLALVAALAYALSSITTTVTSQAVTVAFRWGRPSRTIPLVDIVGLRVVRNNWLYGWGIRWIPGGTMYNVWGLDAVHLELAGRRDFRIGTDDPEGLVAALGHAQASTSQS